MQLIYRTSHADGERLVSDPRIGATGYTGSRSAGLKLKAAADAAGKPIYLELSSVNPVLILPGALAERGDSARRTSSSTSCLMGTGQFCTNPGLVLLLAGEATEQFIAGVGRVSTPRRPARCSRAGVAALARRERLHAADGRRQPGHRRQRPADAGLPLLQHAAARHRATQFLAAPETLQTEAFGNASLVVVADDAGQLAAVIESARRQPDRLHLLRHARLATTRSTTQLAPLLRPRVGRLLNDKMPTGVAVSPAMNHGGPYPGHRPSRLHRRRHSRRAPPLRDAAVLRQRATRRLPALLRDEPPNDKVFRLMDGEWRRGPVPGVFFGASSH